MTISVIGESYGCKSVKSQTFMDLPTLPRNGTVVTGEKGEAKWRDPEHRSKAVTSRRFDGEHTDKIWDGGHFETGEARYDPSG